MFSTLQKKLLVSLLFTFNFDSSRESVSFHCVSTNTFRKAQYRSITTNIYTQLVWMAHVHSCAGRLIRKITTFPHVLLPFLPCHIFNPEAFIWSPTVCPQLIHQSCQSASGVSRPGTSSPAHRGLRPLSGTPSKTTETRWGPARLN